MGKNSVFGVDNRYTTAKPERKNPGRSTSCPSNNALTSKPVLSSPLTIVHEDVEMKERGYDLKYTIGYGTFCKIKLGYCEHMQKKVAVKIISKSKAPVGIQTKFIPRELDVLRSLDHENIIEVYHIMQFSNKIFVVMELAGHGDLLEYIKLRGALPDQRAKKMFYEVASAVGYLHSKNIIHRDLKCEAILLTADGTAKLSGFGFSRILGDKEFSKTFCGSVAYAPPEVLRGMPYTGFGYDVWSLGVVLFIMVCGSMPFDDTNMRTMTVTQVKKRLGFPRQANVSRVCQDLVRGMLHVAVVRRATMSVVLRHPWLKDQAPPCNDISSEVVLAHGELRSAITNPTNTASNSGADENILQQDVGERETKKIEEVLAKNKEVTEFSSNQLRWRRRSR